MAMSTHMHHPEFTSVVFHPQGGISFQVNDEKGNDLYLYFDSQEKWDEFANAANAALDNYGS